MIWQETVENGEIFFTETLNGKKIYPYQNEINEIYSLVNNSKIKPSFIYDNHIVVEGSNLLLEDTNNILNQYKTNKASINNNHLTIENISKENNTITLQREYNNYQKPHIFYQSYNSQNLVTIGNLEDETIDLKINVINTTINIKKIDKETKDIYPQGEASLNNVIIGLFDKDMNLINKYKIENNTIEIKNINFGKYFIKELEAGKGYNLNDNIYEINITEDNFNHTLTIENEVIKKKITIEKKYGETNNLNYEPNIIFEIYDNKNNLINIIKTNEHGIAEIILPYGNYTIKQQNTTTGYQKIDPFIINITNQENELIELTDYKIPIPNTSKNNLLNTILLFILNLLN